jgi:Transcription factor WhiB
VITEARLTQRAPTLRWVVSVQLEGPADLEDYSELAELLPWLMHNVPSHSVLGLEVARLLVRPAWHARAACRGMGTDAFFPRLGETGMEARAICARCPVRRECLATAMNDDERGIWGGQADRDRAQLRRAARDAQRRCPNLTVRRDPRVTGGQVTSLSEVVPMARQRPAPPRPGADPQKPPDRN